MENLKCKLDHLKTTLDSCEVLRCQILLEEKAFQILLEEKVFKEELDDRLEKGLKGVEAIEHFNSFMLRFGLNHMVIDI